MGDNTYPGNATCNRFSIPSPFEPKSNWTRKYALQAEIRSYLEGCVATYRLASRIQFNKEVVAADFDEASGPLTPHYKAGKLILLAQTTAARSPSLPDVPTFQEAGINGLVLDQWLGMFVPVGTPHRIIARLNAEVGRALAD